MALSLFGRIRTVHAVLFGGDYLGNAQRVKVDDEGAVEVITTVHGHAHAGNLWLVGHIWTGIVAAGVVELQLTVGANKNAHFMWGVNSTAQGRIQIFRGPTSSGGTTITPFNVDDSDVSPPSPEATAVWDPTVTGDGTELPLGSVLPGGSGFLASGGSDAELVRGPEIIGRASTKYLVRFTNDSSSAENISLHAGFYEKDVA